MVVVFRFTDTKAELLANLQGLSMDEGLGKLRAMPHCLTEKMELRYTLPQKPSLTQPRKAAKSQG